MLTLNPTHTIPTATQWSAFLSIVADYRRAAPWKIVGYRHAVIAVESPLGRETAYCSIAPNLGFGVGLTIFLGSAGLRSFCRMLGLMNSPDGTGRVVPVGSEEHVRVRDSFEGISFTITDEEFIPGVRYHRIPLEPEDARSGRLLFVEITRHAGGKPTRQPDAIELDFVGDILMQLIATAQRMVREGDSFFDRAGIDRVWTLTPEIDPVSYEISWEGSWKRPEVPIVPEFSTPDVKPDMESVMFLDPKLDRFPPSAQELSLWRGSSKRLEGSDESLIVVITQEAIRVSPKNAPPIRRRLLGAVSIVDGMFVASALLDNPEGDPQEVRQGLMRMFESRDQVPHIIHVGDRRLRDILQPMSRHFGFLLLYSEMPPEIALDLTSFIEAHVTRAADGEDGYGVATNVGRPEGIPDRPPSEGLRNVMLPLEHFCSEHFPATLYQEALDLAAWLDYAEDPSPLERGRPEVWACGIAWHVASIHNLWQAPGDDRLTTEVLCTWFGVKKSTAERRKERIRRMVE